MTRKVLGKPSEWKHSSTALGIEVSLEKSKNNYAYIDSWLRAIVKLSKAIARQLKVACGEFDMKRLGISPGDSLTLKKNSSITCEVWDDHNVIFCGKIMSLSKAAKIALRECGFNWSSGYPACWCFKGKPLN